MLLTYQFELNVEEKTSIILGHLCYAASKLFNVGNYERKEYKSLGFEKMPDWYSQKKRLKDNIWYKSLPSQTSQDVLARLNEAWKSYFAIKSRYEYRKEKGHLKEFPEISKELWNGELWNPSYYVETIGSISEDAIREYIQNQEKE